MHFRLFSFFILQLMTGIGFLYFLILAICFYAIGHPGPAGRMLACVAVCLVPLTLRFIWMRRHEIALTQRAARWYFVAAALLVPAFWFGAMLCFNEVAWQAGALRFTFVVGGVLSLVPPALHALDYDKLSRRENVLRPGPFGPYNPKIKKIIESKREERWRRSGKA